MSAVGQLAVRDRTPLIGAGLLGLAGLGWWWSVHSSSSMGHPSMGHQSMGHQSMGGMTMSYGGFMVAWVAMMAAMMFPAVLPAVQLFGRVAARGQVVATPFFAAGYIAVWSAIGVPVYFAWRALSDPLANGDRWVAYLAGGIFAAAAVYQASPLKRVCLRHCRSPLSFFLRQRYHLNRRLGAVRAGASHGTVCLGCCWAEMAVLVALGTMNVGWMVAVAAVIFAEKVMPRGHLVSFLAAAVMAGFAVALFVHPHVLVHIS